MKRNWLLAAVVAAAAAVVCNEYRIWWHRSQSTIRPAATAMTEPPGEPVTSPPQFAKAGGEEESEAPLIDLTLLLRQTPEPPPAATPEAAPLPSPDRPGAQGAASPPPALPDVPQFRPYAADSSDAAPPTDRLAEFWRKLTGLMGYGPAEDGKSEAAEKLGVMPRAVDEHSYHGPRSECPYLNGTAGASYRRDYPVRLGGAASPATIEAPRRRPKLDTMDIRPGDLPTGWFHWPF